MQTDDDVSTSETTEPTYDKKEFSPLLSHSVLFILWCLLGFVVLGSLLLLAQRIISGNSTIIMSILQGLESEAARFLFIGAGIGLFNHWFYAAYSNLLSLGHTIDMPPKTAMKHLHKSLPELYKKVTGEGPVIIYTWFVLIITSIGSMFSGNISLMLYLGISLLALSILMVVNISVIETQCYQLSDHEEKERTDVVKNYSTKTKLTLLVLVILISCLVLYAEASKDYIEKIDNQISLDFQGISATLRRANDSQINDYLDQLLTLDENLTVEEWITELDKISIPLANLAHSSKQSMIEAQTQIGLVSTKISSLPQDHIMVTGMINDIHSLLNARINTYTLVLKLTTANQATSTFVKRMGVDAVTTNNITQAEGQNLNELLHYQDQTMEEVLIAIDELINQAENFQSKHQSLLSTISP